MRNKHPEYPYLHKINEAIRFVDRVMYLVAGLLIGSVIASQKICHTTINWWENNCNLTSEVTISVILLGTFWIVLLAVESILSNRKHKRKRRQR